MIKMLLIPADIHLPLQLLETNNTYKSLTEGVGGYIEAVPLPEETDNTITVWCNEEGKLNNLPINTRANDLWSQIWGETLLLLDYLVGNIIITGGTDDEGETLTIPQSIVDAIENIGKNN